MNTGVKRVLFWTPRVLCILFALFLGWFALLEVFGEGYGSGETIVPVLMHLVPVHIVVIVLVIAWRREWVGAILFTVQGLSYILVVLGRLRWSFTFVVGGLLVLVGVLFLFNWKYRAQLRTR